MLSKREPSPEQVVFLGLASSVWVLDSAQERFHITSPDDLQGNFIKAMNSEARKGFTQKQQQESLGRAALVH